MNITWKLSRGLPTFVKGGAMGIVDGLPVYAAGCTYPWRETELAWFWEEGKGDWFPVLPPLPLGRAYTHGANLEDGLLVVGGRKRSDKGLESLRDVWWLRRSKDEFTWTPLPGMQTPRAIPSVGVFGRKILVVGGGEWEKSQGGAFTTRHLKHHEILDLDEVNRGWQIKGPLPFPSLVGSAFASVDGSFYLFGGYECWTEENQRKVRYDASAWRCDFNTGAWTRLADCPAPASGWCAAAWKNRIILLGGGLHAELSGVPIPTQSWHTLEAGTPRQRTIGAYSDLVIVYDIQRNEYDVMNNRLPIGLHDLRCALLGATLFAAGGETVDPALSNTINAFMVGSIEGD